MDNKKLGMIRQWQEIVYGGNYHSSDLPAPKWDLLAEAYGWATFKATTPEEVDDAIRAAQAHDGPALVWFEIHETQNVFPMMPAGKGLSDLIEDWGAPASQGEEQVDGRHERSHRRTGEVGAQAALRARLRADPSPRARRARQQPARRPQPRGLHGAQPQLQHRVAGRGPHGAAGHQPHDHHPARRRLRRGADGQAALPAHRRAEGPGPARDRASWSTSWRSSRCAPRSRGAARSCASSSSTRVASWTSVRRRVIVEHSGTEQEIDSLVALLAGFGIKEMVRTGTIALGRGSGAIDLEAILRAGPVPAMPPEA